MQTRSYVPTPSFVPAAVRKSSVARNIALAYSVWLERRALARLDADRLDDIGVSATEAHIEANRPVWDAPSRWVQ